MRKTILALAALVIGIIIGLVVPHLFLTRLNTSWRELHTDPKHFGLGYASPVILSDLPVPRIKSLAGKAKFIEGDGRTAELGFIINVDMAPLDMAKVPQRYKVETKQVIEGYDTTSPPIEQAYYEIEFEFELKDEDGFTLAKLDAKGLPSLQSGTNNVFQAKVEGVPYDTANKVREIWLHPTLTKCYTCLPPPRLAGIN
jgi:hypothetical protein